MIHKGILTNIPQRRLLTRKSQI